MVAGSEQEYIESQDPYKSGRHTSSEQQQPRYQVRGVTLYGII